MNTFLFILKMLGVAITGRATIVGLFKHEVFENIETPSLIITDPPTPPKIERRLTKHGKRAILWAVVGLLISLVAQGVEQSLNIKRARESAANTQTQMLILGKQLELSSTALKELQNQSLQMRQQMAVMNHMAGEFDTLTIDATFELVSTNPAALILIERVAEVASSFIQKTTTNYIDRTPFVTAEVTVPDMIGDSGGSEKPRRGEQIPLGSRTDVTGNIKVVTDNNNKGLAKQSSNVYQLNVVGYVNVKLPHTNDTDLASLIQNTIFARSQGRMGTIVEYDDVFSSNWLASVSSNADFMKLSGCIQLPMLGVRIYSKHTTGLAVEDADLVAPPPTSGTIRPTIGYDSSLRGVLVNWRIEYPSSEWRQTVRLGSVQDLDAATLCVYLANAPVFLTNDFKPLTLKLRFGKTTLKVNNFELQSFERFETGFEPLEPLYPPSVLTNFPTEIRRHYAAQSKPLKLKTNSAAVFKAILPPASYDPIEIKKW